MLKTNILKKIISFSILILSVNFSWALTLNKQNNFKFSYQTSGSQITLAWDITPGTFLYKDKIHIEALTKGLNLQPINWPQGIKHADKLGNQHEIYQNHLELQLGYQAQTAKNSKVKVQYQGCSEAGICFPPEQNTVQFKAIATSAPSKNIILEMLSFLGIGVLLAFTPCVLPMLPIMTRIVVGDRNQQPLHQTIGLSIAYVLGMALTYAAVGALIANIGKNLFVLMQQQWIMLSMAGIYVYFAVATLGYFEIKMPDRFQQKTLNFRSSLKSGRYLTATLMGSLSLLVLSPCVTAPLLGALTYITQLGQVWRGSLALFMLGLGMGIPLMIFAISAGHWLPKAGGWMENVKKVLALLLLSISAILINRAIHAPIALLSWVIVIAASVWLFKPEKNIHGKISTSIRAIILTIMTGYASFISLGVVNSNYLPWPFTNSTVHPDFILKTPKSLDKVLAKKSEGPVLLYFSAKWCATCQYLEKKVWADKALSSLLSKATWVKVDLTDNSAAQLKLMQKYQVVAPPTVILLNPKNKQQTACRLLGEEITIKHLKKWENKTLACQ